MIVTPKSSTLDNVLNSSQFNLQNNPLTDLIKSSLNLDLKKILTNENASHVTLTLSKLNIKTLFTLTVIISFLAVVICRINKLISNFVISHGLGKEEEIRRTDVEKREELLKISGEKIHFESTNKQLLEGMFFKPNLSHDNNKTILICAGSHQSFEYQTIPMVKAFLSMGHNVMVFNYEGFGKSEGAASEKGLYRSVEGAYRYLIEEKKCKEQDVIAWGYSLGSGAATNLALQYKVSLVVDRGFSSMTEVAYQSTKELKKFQYPFSIMYAHLARLLSFIYARFDNFSKLKKIEARILIIKGAQDTAMDGECPKKSLENAIFGNPNATYSTVDSGHNHTDDKIWFTDGGKDRTMLANWISKLR